MPYSNSFLNVYQSRYNPICFNPDTTLSNFILYRELIRLTVITKLPVLQELLNTRTNNIYVEGFDDYVITEMINMLCNE